MRNCWALLLNCFVLSQEASGEFNSTSRVGWAGLINSQTPLTDVQKFIQKLNCLFFYEWPQFWGVLFGHYCEWKSYVASFVPMRLYHFGQGCCYMYERAKQAPLLNCTFKITPCLCFLEQFELLVSSFSAVS